MHPGLIGLAGTLGLLLVAGFAIGLVRRDLFAPRWLMFAALLVALNDACLTRLWRLVPDLLPAADFNWQGKILALIVTLAIAATPLLGGWRRIGFTWRQEPGSLTAALPVVVLYMLFFVTLFTIFPRDHGTTEEMAFQLTMPGLEEEPFYRGLLLLALDRAFIGRVRFLGVDWGWGAVLSCALFGLAHAFGWSDGAFEFSAIGFALTATPALLAVWLRLRTGSLSLPILLHNFGNVIGLLL